MILSLLRASFPQQLSVWLPVRLSVCLSVHPSVCLSICQAIHPPIHLSVCLFWLSVPLSVCPPISLPVCPPLCLSIRLSVYRLLCFPSISPEERGGCWAGNRFWKNAFSMGLLFVHNYHGSEGARTARFESSILSPKSFCRLKKACVSWNPLPADLAGKLTGKKAKQRTVWFWFSVTEFRGSFQREASSGSTSFQPM